ncbi:hypothetical protein EIN_291370 [Entamoeba invadens IP1]|uniref:Leucine rich repeat containing protein BspA family protein n=1 Tax=Entamoeba invadens IP1 TaxID=370355 RepID=A0A0A1UAG2_ENTIV|nr:hypothetical protein EIN_291370 [Entamoeba invadens IP1]ELP92038.1 hypothetical protein EIN_291370 [Entamoeba invadens IP1]|eukprot:XP_004258809.1 hypothetical protein EIN_291370 [Entamoeba invadens IP1]
MKYFKTMEDYLNVISVCKKFQDSLLKFHFNPIPITSKTKRLFPKIETQYMYNKEDLKLPKVAYIVDYISYTYKETLVDLPYQKVVYKNAVFSNRDMEMYKKTHPTSLEHYYIKHFKLPKSVSGIGQNALIEETKIVDMKFHDSLKFVGQQAFEGLSNLQTLTLPNSVTSLGEFLCYNCVNLKIVKLPLYLQVIPSSCFGLCSSLETIEIPDFVTEIGRCAFFSCRSLATIGVPKSVVCVGEFAFMNCNTLNELRFSKKLNFVGKGVFLKCSSLVRLKMPKERILSCLQIPDNCVVDTMYN